MICHRLPILCCTRCFQVSAHVELTSVRVDLIVKMRQPRNTDDRVSWEQLISSQLNGTCNFAR